jgi:hypothetical protein
MSTKLTLRIDEGVIRRAKAYSKDTGKSLSQLISDYLSLLPEPAGTVSVTAPLTPLVQSLYGLLRGSQVDEQDYRRHLEDKYR